MTSYSTILQYIKENKPDKAIEALENNIREEELKRNGGRVSDLTLIKRVMKNSAYDSAIEFTFDGVKYYAFTDGRYLLASTSDYGYNVSYKNINFEDMFKRAFGLEQVRVNKADVKAFAKMHKRSDRPIYSVGFGNLNINLNPYYLQDVIDWTGSEDIHFDCNKHTMFDCLSSPIVLHGNDRLAMLLPIIR